MARYTGPRTKKSRTLESQSSDMIKHLKKENMLQVNMATQENVLLNLNTHSVERKTKSKIYLRCFGKTILQNI
jgi:hypothetical protein